MSFTAETWAWNEHCGSGIAKAVLIYLGFRADRRTGECWPSLPSIVRAVEHTERSVRAALAELVRQGKVKRERRHARDGRCISTRYRLAVVCAAVEESDLAAEPAEVALDTCESAAVEPEPTPAKTQGTPPPPTPAFLQGEPLSQKDSTDKASESARTRAPAQPPLTGDQNLPRRGASETATDLPPASRRRGERGTPLPDDWNPTADDRAFARSLDLDPGEIVLQFADHYRATGGVRADWSAAWRKWCRNEPQFRRRPVRAAARPRPAWLDSDVWADVGAHRGAPQ